VAHPYPVAIKAETPDTLTVGGWGVVFGGADLTGEYFAADTDYWLDRLGPTKVALYDHGFDEALKARVLGTGTLERKSADGVDGLWFEAQLDKHQRYVTQIRALVEAGVMGLSSGAVAHLVEREPRDGKTWIKAWPVAEVSLTVTPAEPRTIGVEAVRALADHAEALKALLPDAVPPQDDPAHPAYVPPYDPALHRDDPAERTAKAAPAITVTPRFEAAEPPTHKDTPVSEEFDALKGEVGELKSGLASINTLLGQVLQQMQDEPAIRSAGYFTVDGGAADPTVKSFGDWLISLQRRDHKRLATVYKSVPETKDLTEGVGTQGGYLVPEEYHRELLRAVTAASPILSRVRRIPVRTDAGTFPALNQFAAPTAGAGTSAASAGIAATNVAEGGTLTETNATFKEIRYVIHKMGGYTEVSNELVADSPFAIEELLRGLFSVAVMQKLERHILRGSGVGEPLGLLNAPCAIAITPTVNNEFNFDDALAMRARFKNVSGGSPVWVIHPGIWPDLAVMESAGGAAVWQANMAVGGPQSLLGWEIVESEHNPQDDNAGGVGLYDLGSYLLFERQALSVAFSEHAAFTTDKGTWRFTYRCDGQPWLTSAITLADPQGSYTVSPVVYHND
jgi:HK97 family phage major capsid protein